MTCHTRGQFYLQNSSTDDRCLGGCDETWLFPPFCARHNVPQSVTVAYAYNSATINPCVTEKVTFVILIADAATATAVI